MVRNWQFMQTARWNHKSPTERKEFEQPSQRVAVQNHEGNEESVKEWA